MWVLVLVWFVTVCVYLCESLILSVHTYVCAVCTHTFNCTYTNGNVVLHTEL